MPVLATGLALAGLASQGYNLYDSYKRRKEAEGQLANLGKQKLPEYGVSPEILNYYRTGVDMASSPRGYSAAERANFRSGITRQLGAQRMAARNIVGGSQSRALGALDILPRIQSESQLASGDAQLARQQQNQAFGRMYQGANTIQSIRDRNTQAALQRRLMTEQALGGAIRSQRDFARNTIGNIGSDALGAGLMMGVNGRRTQSTSGNDIPFAGVRNDIYDFFNPVDETELSRNYRYSPIVVDPLKTQRNIRESYRVRTPYSVPVG